MTLSAWDFSAFFRAMHGYDPFPWQEMLAARVVQTGWPDVLDLPTGSGKTACLDVGIFALACQVDRPAAERTAARRIFFVVDRRIVVDAAYQRALKIAHSLQEATEGPVLAVAEALRRLHGGPLPLLAARMRGGVARDDGWMFSPTQPAIITGTVDQVGSRLLFRAYGPRLTTAPIHAGLIGNDSLIVLDEAHCAVPFYQTVSGVARYRRPEWAKEPLLSPFNLVVMSATPPEGATDVWPSPAERSIALDHPKLDLRLNATKLAELVTTRAPKRPKAGEAGLRSGPVSDDDLVSDAADRAIKMVAAGRKRVVIMVNRVRTARMIHQQLVKEDDRSVGNLGADLVLLTGRMRPLDRDAVVDKWRGALEASENQPTLDRAVIVVTTQCLEVGADYSFDALITECASLDSLRQRFGRLDRLGSVGDAAAVILARKSQIKDEEKLEKLDGEGKLDDPIYGNALARTWNWLNAVATAENGRLAVDLGVTGLENLLPMNQEVRRSFLVQLNAPAPDAPVLLPMHLDCWVQTAPPPTPDPDPAVFLHGPNRGEPEVSVILRADLAEDAHAQWPEVASLSPPSSVEALSVPLRVMRAWVGGVSGDADPGGDVEGEVRGDEEDEEQRARRPVLIWKGRDRSKVTMDAKEIRPNQVLMVPATSKALSLGDFLRDGVIEDIGDAASYVARRRARIRVNEAVLKPWKDHAVVAALLEWGSAEEVEDDGVLSTLLGALANIESQIEVGSGLSELPDWLRNAAGHLMARSRRRVPLKHPAGGWVIDSRARMPTQHRLAEPVEEDSATDVDDLTSTSDCDGGVSLQTHLADVASMVEEFAHRCLPSGLNVVLREAARMHDLGKADWRFQVMLHRGNEIEAYRAGAGGLLAKSTGMPQSRAAAARARQLSGLPEGWRHEMLSLQIAERAGLDNEPQDLLLHLIASHHGHARPFAPVIPDPDPGTVDLAGVGGAPAGLDAESRRGSVPPHRVDSGVPKRFWLLTRRYGWWGLAYLEAILRLADWAASAREESAAGTGSQARGVA